MLEPDLEPFNGLAREISHPALPLGIGLTPADQRLAGAVRPELNVSQLKRHELSATRERFVSHAEHSALSIRSEPFARISDKFLDLVPTQGTSLSLPSGGLAAHFLERQAHRFARTGIQ